MKKLPLAIQCGAIAGVIMIGCLTVSAQTPVLQLKASNYNAVTGVWTDSSGSGDTATYAGSSIPTLATGATPNHSSAVNFAHAGVFNLLTSLPGTSGYTVFAYVEQNATSSTYALTGGTGVGGLEYRINGTHQDSLREYQQDLGSGSGTLSTLSFSLIDVAVSSAGGTYRLNGAADGTIAANAGFGGPITIIGNNAGGGEAFSGYVSEIDVYSGILTSPQISTIEGNLLTAYAVPEPTTWAMMAGGFSVLLASRRFRRPQA